MWTPQCPPKQGALARPSRCRDPARSCGKRGTISLAECRSMSLRVPVGARRRPRPASLRSPFFSMADPFKETSMANPKRKSAGEEPAQTTSEAASKGSNAIGEALLAMHKEYLRAVQDIVTRAQHRCSQAQFDYMRSMYEAQLNAQKAQESAYRSYVSGMQDTCAKGNAPQLAREVEQRYVKDVEGGQ